MSDEFTGTMTKQEVEAAHVIADVAIAKALELRATLQVLLLAVVTVHEHARVIADAAPEQADDLFKRLATVLREAAPNLKSAKGKDR